MERAHNVITGVHNKINGALNQTIRAYGQKI